MGLLDSLLGLFVFDRIVTFALFCIVMLIMLGVIVGYIIYDPSAFFDSDATSDNNPHHYELKIVTDGSWEGSISSKDVKMEDIYETGDKKIDLGNSTAKDIDIDLSTSDSFSDKLTAKLYSDGKVVDSDTAKMPNEKIVLSA